MAGAGQARNATRARLSIHPADEDWLRSLPRQAEMFGFDGAEIPTVDFFHADGDEVALGQPDRPGPPHPGPLGRARAASGSPRPTCSSPATRSSPARWGGPTCRAATSTRWPRSIRQRLFPLGDEVAFHPGHGPSGTIGEERRLNPFVGEAPLGRGQQFL